MPLSEGFGLPPLEAMSAGTPTVVSETVPSTAPAEGATPAAERVDPTTIGAIGAALVRVSTDDSLRAALVEAGRRLVA